jgi:hypothetical protein
MNQTQKLANQLTNYASSGHRSRSSTGVNIAVNRYFTALLIAFFIAYVASTTWKMFRTSMIVGTKSNTESEAILPKGAVLDQDVRSEQLHEIGYDAED